jgi:hypothetical protein
MGVLLLFINQQLTGGTLPVNIQRLSFSLQYDTEVLASKRLNRKKNEGFLMCQVFPQQKSTHHIANLINYVPESNTWKNVGS